MSNNPIFDRIEFLCRRKGVNITQMCAEAGITRGTFTDMKHGRQQSLSAVKASKVADYLGVSVEYLLYGEKKEKPPVEEELVTAKELDLIKLFRLVPDSDQDMILAMLQGVLKSKGLI